MQPGMTARMSLTIGTRRIALAPLVVVLIAAALTLTWALAPAEWSFVDDAGLKQALDASVREHGVLSGISHQVGSMVDIDRSWGLFRPLYWVYAATFYLLGAPAAHGLRMLLFVLAIVVPVAVVHRRARANGGRAALLALWAGLVLLANSTLYEGLSLLSLQELSGVALVALGLLAERRAWVRSLLWLGAAWFKAPFVWLGLGWGVVLLRRGERVKGGVTCLAALATLAAAAAFARHGSYTHQFGLGSAALGRDARDLVTAMRVPGAVALAGMVGLLISPLRVVPRDGTAAALAVGGIGYLANMLPWGLGSYYPSPVIWLLSTAALLAIAGSERPAESRQALARPRLQTALLGVGLIVAVALSGRLTAKTVSMEYDRNASLAGLRDWAVSLPVRGVTIGINGQEASVRLPELVRMSRADWNDQVVFVAPGQILSQTPDYYVLLPDQGAATPAYQGRALHTWKHAVIYATSGG